MYVYSGSGLNSTRICLMLHDILSRPFPSHMITAKKQTGAAVLYPQYDYLYYNIIVAVGTFCMSRLPVHYNRTGHGLLYNYVGIQFTRFIICHCTHC